MAAFTFGAEQFAEVQRVAVVVAKVEKVAKKGKTLEQIENEEGGPIKESMVGMAHNKRAAKRKGAAGK